MERVERVVEWRRDMKLLKPRWIKRTSASVGLGKRSSSEETCSNFFRHNRRASHKSTTWRSMVRDLGKAVLSLFLRQHVAAGTTLLPSRLLADSLDPCRAG